MGGGASLDTKLFCHHPAALFGLYAVWILELFLLCRTYDTVVVIYCKYRTIVQYVTLIRMPRTSLFEKRVRSSTLTKMIPSKLDPVSGTSCGILAGRILLKRK